MLKPPCTPARYSPALTQRDQAIARRLAPPTPEQVRAARKHARLTQQQAAELVRETGKRLYRTWQRYEMLVQTSAYRRIPLATWELFLLLTGQHPDVVSARKDPPEAAVDQDPRGST